MARILVVDDDRVLRSMFEMMLTKIGGHEVHLAADTQAALLIANTVNPQIAIIDMLLSQKSGGLGLANKLRQMDPTLRIVLTSGIHEEDIETHGYPFLQKPFVLHDLASKIAGQPENPPRM